MADESAEVVVSIPPAEPPAPAVVVPAAEEEEELDFVAQLVAEESILREEQHDEMMEVLAECQTMLAGLSQLREQMGAENPMLTQIQSQMTELQNQVEQIRGQLERANHPASTNPGTGAGSSQKDIIPTATPSMEGSEKSPPPSSSAPSEVNPPPPPKKRRFAKL